jgi:hypothetical protein
MKLNKMYGNYSHWLTYPRWDSNRAPRLTRLNIPVAEDGLVRFQAPLWQTIFLFTSPGCYRMVIRYSLRSGYWACSLCVRTSVLISAILITSIRGLHQFIHSNALSTRRHLISSHIHHSQSCGHHMILWHDAWKPEQWSQSRTTVMSVAKQQLCKHLPVATNKHATIEELPEAVFYMGSDLNLYKKYYQSVRARDAEHGSSERSPHCWKLIQRNE